MGGGGDGGSETALPGLCTQLLHGLAVPLLTTPASCYAPQTLSGRRGRQKRQPQPSALPAPWGALPTELLVEILRHLTLTERCVLLCLWFSP